LNNKSKFKLEISEDSITIRILDFIDISIILSD